MKNKLFALIVLAISFFAACKKDDVVEKKNTISTIGYAKAVIDNGDTIYFDYIKKSKYSVDGKLKGNLYIAYLSSKDTFSSSQQLKFAIYKNENLDYLAFIKPSSSNVGSELTVTNKSFMNVTDAVEIPLNIEKMKDSTKFETSAKNRILNINYALLKVTTSPFE